MLVAEALPGIGALTDAICKDEPKPCSKDLLTDAENCGACGNVVCLISFVPPCPPTMTTVCMDFSSEGANKYISSVQQVSAQTELARVTLARARSVRRSALVDLAVPVYVPARLRELGTVLMAAHHVQA